METIRLLPVVLSCKSTSVNLWLLFFPHSSYGSRLSRSHCFPPWARWRATCSSVSTRQRCTKNWRTRLAGCATFALSCRSSSWWRATVVEQSACWTPKSAFSSARVRRHHFWDFPLKLKLSRKLLHTLLPPRLIRLLSLFDIANKKKKHLRVGKWDSKSSPCTTSLKHLLHYTQ